MSAEQKFSVKTYRKDYFSKGEEYLFKVECYQYDAESGKCYLLEAVTYGNDGELVEHAENNYDCKNRIVKRFFRREDAQSTTVDIREFDDANTACTEKNYFNEENVLTRVYQLNESGLPVSIKTFFFDKLYTEEQLQYQGENCIKHLIENFDEGFLELVEQEYNSDGELVSWILKKDNKVCRSETLEYNQFGQVARRTFKEYDDAPTSELYEYNHKGKLLLTTHYSLDYPIGMTANTYDELGNLSSSEYTDEGGNVCKRAKYAYDGQGRLVQEIEMQKDDPEGTYSERYEYSDSVSFSGIMDVALDKLTQQF